VRGAGPAFRGNRAGSPINPEADIIAKYVERILSFGGPGGAGGRDGAPGITPEKLAELGYK
jgi:hypothetical protein